MYCWEQNIHFQRRMGVLAEGVCLIARSGENALAPRLGILGRGARQVHGQWGPIAPACRETLGSAVFVPREPRNRMGFGGAASEHARYQLQWHVHRIARSFVDWGGVYGAPGAGPAREGGLLSEAHRAGTG